MAREAIELAREQVAALLAVSPSRVVFTAGATEAANTAVASAVLAAETRSPVAVADVEHSCVRESARRAGPVVALAVDASGRISTDSLRDALAMSPRPALVNCQWGNHELGTLQPVTEVAEACAEAGVPLHIDAAASAGHVPIELGSLPVAYTSVSAYKLGGPAGIGALVLGRGVRLRPLLVGGSEERTRRAGAENLLGIIGFGAAAGELLEPGRLDAERARAEAQRDALVRAALDVPGVSLLGPERAEDRLPHVACFSLEGVLGEAVLLALDRRGIAAHSGSACSSEILEPSPVLAAIGADPERSLRVSVGWSTTEADVEAFATELPTAVADLRALGREMS